MLEQLKECINKKESLIGDYGIERELLRVDDKGGLSLEPHPKVFGNKLKNPYITTDFAESQVELITPPSSSVEEAYHCANVLYDIVSMEVEDELLWPQSMPSVIQGENIRIAEFDDSEDGREARAYRESLIKKYGGKKQLISGIHYNFSFSKKLIKKLYKMEKSQLNYQDFKDQIYLKVTRNYLRYRWLIIYLLGATPLVHESYKNECDQALEEISPGVYSNDGAISFRNGYCGYRNIEDLFPQYDTVEAHLKSVGKFIQEGIIRGYKELYSPIRLKPKDKQDFEKSLLEEGIQYLEYRGIDINPFEKAGISLNDLHFLQLFNLFLFVQPESNYDKWQEEAMENHYKIAEDGQREVLLKKDGLDISKTQWALSILEEVLHINKELGLEKEEVIQTMMDRVKDYKNTYAYKITQKIKKEGYVDGHLNLAKKYKNQSHEKRFKLEGYEDLELSTQILMKEAVKRGIEVRVLDRKDNFISLEKDGKVEFVKQATKTSKDNYVSVLIMENKSLTKNILADHDIKVPRGIEVRSLEELKENIKGFINKPLVIKPKSTNFGVGIHIFKEGASEKEIIKAWEMATEYEDTLLMEEFIGGKEYRFLVIDHRVCAILHRVPANVVGDGRSTIEELVTLKNQDPLRGNHYVTPLEKIKLDENARIFLEQQGKNFTYRPKEGEVVYLRETSNISTGGDSIDYTEDIPERFKEIAVQATKAVDVRFCGIDMIIEDYRKKDSDYGIIELNFNPAIHIHSYPYKGKERNVAQDVLRALGFEIN
jgi:glutamate--cysteine ligase